MMEVEVSMHYIYTGLTSIFVNKWKVFIAICNTLFELNVIFVGKFGIVYKAYYTPEENKTIEVAVKTVKCVLFKL